MLAAPQYLDLPADVLLACLTKLRRGRWNCAPEATQPAPSHTAWLLELMRRYGHLPPGTDVAAIAQRSVDAEPFRRAAKGMNLNSPTDDAAPRTVVQPLLKEHA
jgi:hypothetical protein